MARIPLIHPEAVDGDLADFYATVNDVFGRIPNSLRTWRMRRYWPCC